MGAHINEDLVLKNKELVEENSRLREELQMIRRSFHGTLNALNIQLSAGENKISLLQETISTYKEALVNSNNVININNVIPEVSKEKEDLMTKHLKEQVSTELPPPPPQLESRVQVEKNDQKCLPSDIKSEQSHVVS